MKVLIIEDETLAAKRLRRMLLEIDPVLEIPDALDSIESAVEWWGENPQPDLLFLDIHLADGSSFELFSLLTITKPVIFVTAYDQYAIQAFKVNAVDYLLKPIRKEELIQAYDKYKTLTSRIFDYERLVHAITPKHPERRFLIKIGQKIQLIETSEIAWFCTENKVTILVTKAGRRFPVDESLEKLEEILDPKKFFRINRQYLISLESIGEMFSYSRSRVKINLIPPASTPIIVSTERSPHFKKWLTGED